MAEVDVKFSAITPSAGNADANTVLLAVQSGTTDNTFTPTQLWNAPYLSRGAAASTAPNQASRSGAARWTDWLNVLDFGADPNGVVNNNDSTAAFQAMVNVAAGLTPGRAANILGCMYVPPGNYLVGSNGVGVIMPATSGFSSWYLVGDGIASKITVSASLNGVAFKRVQATGAGSTCIMVIDGLWFFGLMGANTPSTLIQLESCVLPVIQNCQFSYTAGNGSLLPLVPAVPAVLIGRSCFQATIKQCNFVGPVLSGASEAAPIGGSIGLACSQLTTETSGQPPSPIVTNCNFTNWDVGIQTATDGILDCVRVEECVTGIMIGVQRDGGVATGSPLLRDVAMEACFTFINARAWSNGGGYHIAIKPDLNTAVQRFNTNFTQLTQTGTLAVATLVGPLPQNLSNLTLGVITGCANNGSGLIRVTCGNINVSSGVYTPATGAVTLSLASALNFQVGLKIQVSLTGAGGLAAALNGIVTATAGTGGSTLNFTGPIGLSGALTITGGTVLCPSPTNPALATNNTVKVFGVTGTTEANGNWIVTVINSTTFDLQGSAFTNAWTGGGNIGTLWYGNGFQFGVNIPNFTGGTGYQGNWLATVVNNNINGIGGNPYVFSFTAATSPLPTLSGVGNYNLNSVYGIRLTTVNDLVLESCSGGGAVVNFLAGWDTTTVANQYGINVLSSLLGTNTVAASRTTALSATQGLLWQIPTQSTGITFQQCVGAPSTATVFNNLPGRPGAIITALGTLQPVDGMRFDITDSTVPYTPPFVASGSGTPASTQIALTVNVPNYVTANMTIYNDTTNQILGAVRGRTVTGASGGSVVTADVSGTIIQFDGSIGVLGSWSNGDTILFRPLSNVGTPISVGGGAFHVAVRWSSSQSNWILV